MAQPPQSGQPSNLSSLYRNALVQRTSHPTPESWLSSLFVLALLSHYGGQAGNPACPSVIAIALSTTQPSHEISHRRGGDPTCRD